MPSADDHHDEPIPYVAPEPAEKRERVDTLVICSGCGAEFYWRWRGSGLPEGWRFRGERAVCASCGEVGATAVVPAGGG